MNKDELFIILDGKVKAAFDPKASMDNILESIRSTAAEGTPLEVQILVASIHFSIDIRDSILHGVSEYLAEKGL